MDEQVKGFYREHHDRITDKRWNSDFPLRRYVHRSNYLQMLRYVDELTPPGGIVLDTGCGDGLLSHLIALKLQDKHVTIVGTDLSAPNIKAAKARKEQSSPTPNLHYILSDAEKLSFQQESFDLVVSSHVLEHLPNFDDGARELYRLTRHYAIVALPTCLNLCAMTLLGGDVFWRPARRSMFAIWIGLARVLRNIGGEGVDEGYAGNQALPHVWRYPWVMRRRLRTVGFKIQHFEAQTLCIPYMGSIFPKPFLAIQRVLDHLRSVPPFRELGYGSLAIVRK